MCNRNLSFFLDNNLVGIATTTAMPLTSHADKYFTYFDESCTVCLHTRITLLQNADDLYNRKNDRILITRLRFPKERAHHFLDAIQLAERFVMGDDLCRFLVREPIAQATLNLCQQLRIQLSVVHW